jgi:alginate O-acetyltransferase complex protein AlgJ
VAASLKKDEKVVRGRNGRLFLANDRNDVLNQQSGRRMLSDQELARWDAVLEERRRLGIPYVLLVPPNAQSVYPEDLPAEVASARRRPIHQLLEHQPGLIYPLDDLEGAKPDPLLYSKGDAHWTGRGAFVAYKRLAREIASMVDLHEVDRDAVVFREVLRVGELDYKLESVEKSADVFAAVVEPRATLVSDNRVINTGMHIVTRCAEAPPTTCVVFGDSFTGHLLPFLAASFRRLVFCHLPMLDLDVIEEERPDIIVSVMNERFLVVVPAAVARGTLREQERDKLDRDIVRQVTRAFPQ